mmetsp:Transcript_97081/g.257958  ORF Transcript_97081/g.257958 Transcript_97081/m.257958 type:complete len:404 (-) Transcript_97081:77-1288(-)
MSAADKMCGIPLKWVSLTMMVVQTVSMVLLLRVSRTQHVDGPRYLNTTAIFFGEVLKLFSSLALHWYSSKDSADFREALSLQTGALHPLSLAMTSVPSLLYAVQNNLLYVGISHLSAGTYQVTCQFKILTTAFLSVLILGTKLGYDKWAALLLLTAGVAIVDTSGGRASASTAGAESASGTAMGLSAVAGACFISGLAGVYLEKMLKQSNASLWVRNIQLALSGLLFSAIIAWRADGAAIKQNGVFQGYNTTVWAVVFCQALGGLLVAAVMKYADNILKCFGCAIAIVLTCTFSAVELHEIRPDGRFAAGVTLVLASTGMYNLGLPKLTPETRPLLASKADKMELPMSVRNGEAGKPVLTMGVQEAEVSRPSAELLGASIRPFVPTTWEMVTAEADKPENAEA